MGKAAAAFQSLTAVLVGLLAFFLLFKLLRVERRYYDLARGWVGEGI
ncbi:MAG: hypothetical protein JXB47_00425 [Anaerolineae bacterium]|nr:hypothetical protein [Anaerolineae bacterium]